MLTIFLTCVLVVGVQAAQPQGNSGTQSAADPSQMSLAERAAAARKAAAARANRGETSHPDGPPPLTAEQRGTVRGNAYINNLLHFRIALTQWQPQRRHRPPAGEPEPTGVVALSRFMDWRQWRQECCFVGGAIASGGVQRP
jgi:hypothetical protein